MKSSPNKALSNFVTSISIGLSVLIGLLVVNQGNFSQPNTAEVLGASITQKTIALSGKNYACMAVNCAQNKKSYDCRSNFDYKGKGICYWNLSKSTCGASMIYKTLVTPYGNLNMQIRKLNKLNDSKTPELVWYNCRMK